MKKNKRPVFDLTLFSQDPPAVPPAGDPPADPPAAPPAPPADPPAPAAGDPPVKPTGPPESYADFTLPEGMIFDRESAADFMAIAKKLNLTQEQAQELVDVYGTRMQGAQAKQQEQIQGWMKESEKKYKPEEINLAKNTLARFAGDSFKEFLDITGLNVHPEMVAVFKNIGEQISEGKFVDGGGGKSLSDGDIFYPSMKRK